MFRLALCVVLLNLAFGGLVERRSSDQGWNEARVRKDEPRPGDQETAEPAPENGAPYRLRLSLDYPQPGNQESAESLPDSDKGNKFEPRNRLPDVQVTPPEELEGNDAQPLPNNDKGHKFEPRRSSLDDEDDHNPEPDVEVTPPEELEGNESETAPEDGTEFHPISTKRGWNEANTGINHSPFIVNGEYVQAPGTWPSMCSIQLGTWHYCGASLISDTWLVTAAHCLIDQDTKNMFIVCGVLDHEDHSVGSMEVHGIESWHLHKDYKWDWDLGYPHDMAVIKLKWPINPYNPYVKPVKLAEDDGYVWAGADCHAAGWGKTSGNGAASDKLKQAKLDILTPRQCQYYWGDNMNAEHVCAKDMLRHNQGACNGDSGGPLYCEREGETYQVGVFNWMAGDCHPYWPAMYSSVPVYRSWIKEHSGV